MSQVNQRSEQIKRSLRADRQFQDMLAQAAQRENAGRVAQQFDDPAVMGLRAVYAGNQTRNRRARAAWRKAVRDFIGLLVILAICAAGWWLFLEWQALGGRLH